MSRETDAPSKVCLHVPCSCRVDGDALYCTDACKEGSASGERDGCRCGHDHCKGTQA